MHGIVLYGLKEFVQERYGMEAWDAIAEETDLDRDLFLPLTTYPGDYVRDLVSEASKVADATPRELQYEFGRYLVPTLLDTFEVHVRSDWEGLDLVENVEECIHEALRKKEIGEYSPPAIDAERRGADRVVVTYDSEREMCDIARGILDGVADHYGESWTVTERSCMHDGDGACQLFVERDAPAADVPATDRPTAARDDPFTST